MVATPRVVLWEDSVIEPCDPAKFVDDDVKQQQVVREIAQTESRRLKISKILVIVSIITASIVVTAVTYIILHDSEQQRYTQSYVSFAKTIRDHVGFHMENTFSSTRSLSKMLTTEAKSLAMEFPNVTYPSFEALAESIRNQGGFPAIFYAPIVNGSNLRDWNAYTVRNQGWMQVSQAVATSSVLSSYQGNVSFNTTIQDGVFFGIPERGIDIQKAPSYGGPPYMPIWMQSPPPAKPSLINFDLYVPAKITIDAAIRAREAVFSEVQDVTLLAPGQNSGPFQGILNTGLLDSYDEPQSTMYMPIFKQLNSTGEIVAIVAFLLDWRLYLKDLLPPKVKGITCVLKNTCGQAFTYELDGENTRFIGQGDMHDMGRNGSEVVVPFYDFIYNETKTLGGHCVYSLNLYTTPTYESTKNSSTAVILTVIVSCTFAFMMVTFSFYDWLVRKRNTKVLDIATKTTALVSNLFPSNVRDRLLQGDHSKESDQGPMKTLKKEYTASATRSRLKHFLESDNVIDDDSNSSEDLGLDAYGSKPIADIFPHTTVFFGDIVGFTAWSSTREPTQVFTLLEAIYKAFDVIAMRRRVFKVETVGDCYVAVCGLPDPRSDHAVVMARFARSCLLKLTEMVHKLEVVLGPDTADLSIRIGLHSGPVTAGVLRGERARFQLFGDTMNTASRMESTGERGKIQISQETADLLAAAGKTEWFYKRDGLITAKGKGRLQTYWLNTDGEQSQRPSSMSLSTKAISPAQVRDLDRSDRLVQWNSDLLLRLLREIEAARVLEANSSAARESGVEVGSEVPRGRTVLDEVVEIIHLPNLTSHLSRNASDVVLAPAVEKQLQTYITKIASLYRDNPFHCFEHASHVTMSVSKLLSRIVAPELSREQLENGNIVSTLHDHTYGITSDPLTQFACVFSALIHDADHSGVPNTQLAVENPTLAELYGNRSIAEQNSVDLAWKLLMTPEFGDLRSAIYKSPAEEVRFRQLVVNSVMATDIMDKDLKKLRNERWDRAFSTNTNFEESVKDAIDRKATIVIEHLIQASDIAHTMQHWHIYRKWNQKLYTEQYKAFINGRTARDPAEYWYQGEIGFFDFYIIPLANKLKDCGVFGVSSDEYLNYAMKNREEWEQRGREVVAEMADEMNKLFPKSQGDLRASVKATA